jgi:DNA-binding XRE family transcriptional regulator
LFMEAELITGRQIRAARALLDMSQDDLANAAGLTKQGISKIEDGSVQPREGTIMDIVRVFSDRGIEFTEHNGVRQIGDTVIRLEGTKGFKEFLDDVYAIATQPCSREWGDKPIYIGHVDDRYFAEYLGDYFTSHIQRMNTLGDLKMKILVRERPHTLIQKEKEKSGYREYRQSLAEGNVPFYVYGNKLAILIFQEDKPVQIVVISSELVSKAYRTQFETMWNSAKSIDSSNLE